jgi:diguanylate cyclase (GGDEF)-like protein
MKSWIKRLVDELTNDGGTENAPDSRARELSEDRATLLFMVDVLNKHLIDMDRHPVRRVREQLDDFARALARPSRDDEDLLFKVRQWFSSYRIDETTYIQNTFDDFKTIVWSFADQLSEDVKYEQSRETAIRSSLTALREAVESNSIDQLRSQSRQFIKTYVDIQAERDTRRQKRMKNVRRNLTSVRRKLDEAQHVARVDHLTGAYNRRSFDDQVRMQHGLSELSTTPCTLVICDIDFFKKVNDTYGHDIGDFVLKECVNLLKSSFHRDEDFVARIGGEEFALVLSEQGLDASVHRIEELMAQIRKDVFVHGQHEIRFTMSFGLALLQPGETVEQWIKRADEALYHSKQTGRNRLTVAPHRTKLESVA